MARNPRAFSALVHVACLSFLACDAPESAAEAEAEPTTILLRTLAFAEVVDGQSPGFDLDGDVTAAGGGDGCGKRDATAPDGTEGIDNAFGSLIPLIASLGGESLPRLLQNAVTSGELLIGFHLDELDATEAGTCASGVVLRASGVPMLGTDGLILPWQSFGLSDEISPTPLGCAAPSDDGAIDIDGFQVRLPLNVFDETIDLTLESGRARLTPSENGWTGVLAGGVSVQTLADNVYGFDAIPEALEEGTVGAIRLAADLAPDEDDTCAQISVTMAFDAVPAFLYEGVSP